MKEVRYMISETAKKVDVEAHVLRYWEEELAMTIGRTEMGHRYYTPDDIVLLKNIKELKEQGFQLKAIKMLMPELMKSQGKGIDRLLSMREELNEKVNMENEGADVCTEPEDKAEVVTVQRRTEPLTEKDEKMIHFQQIIKNVVLDALQENNEQLEREMGRHVSESVIKELDYMVRVQDEKEEERFKQLDETIRNFQVTRREVAAAEKVDKKRFGRLHKNKKKVQKIS